MQAKGRVFKYGDNVDTDVIIPARYLNATKGEELAKHCMEDIDKEFIHKVQQGDIIGTIMRADGGTEMLHMEVYLGDEEGMLTQSGNRTYKYVDDSKYYVRRSDLIDPTFLKDLPQ